MSHDCKRQAKHGSVFYHVHLFGYKFRFEQKNPVIFSHRSFTRYKTINKFILIIVSDLNLFEMMK